MQRVALNTYCSKMLRKKKGKNGGEKREQPNTRAEHLGCIFLFLVRNLYWQVRFAKNLTQFGQFGPPEHRL